MTRDEMNTAPINTLYEMMEKRGFTFDASRAGHIDFIKDGEVVATRGWRHESRDRGGRAFMIDTLLAD